MQVIEAVINQRNLHDVFNALDEMGVEDFMESAVNCHVRQKEQFMRFRGARFVANVVEKVKLEIVAADDSVENIIKTIGSIARAGRRDTCRIAVRPYLEVT